MSRKEVISVVLLIFVALSVCSVQYHRVRFAVLAGPHPEYKVNSYMSMSEGLNGFKKSQKYFWKGRVVSCTVSNVVMRLTGNKLNKTPFNKLADSIALDNVLWLALTLIVIIALSKNQLMFILGLSAALQYAWLPQSEAQINPWDGPTLFFWTLVLLVNTTKHKRLILILIPLGALFKEIIAILSILILFWDDMPIKQRVKWFMVSGSLCVLIKMACSSIGGSEHILGNQSLEYELNAKTGKHQCRTGERFIWQNNFHRLFQWNNFNPVYFAISGLWLGIFAMPIHRKYKIIAATYMCTVFIPGNINEGRLWQELIPVFFVGYERMKYATDKR